MKILVAHNNYRSSTPSGENEVFRAEVDLLRQHGHQVVTFERHNDDLDRASGLSLLLRHAPAILWSRRARRDLTAVLQRERPDVAHFHNVFPQISPSAYRACRDAGVPVVQTVHNYRIACANGLFFRSGHICEECVTHGPWRAARHGCYNDSRLQSAVVAAGQALHRGLRVWHENVDAFIVLTEFAKAKLTAIGLPAQRLHVKPNFLARPAHPPGAPTRSKDLVFVGKLDVYKGVPALLEAHRLMPRVRLHVVGSGPLGEQVRSAAQLSGGWLVHHGLQPIDQVLELIAGARALVMPSIWYETFGRTIMEAFALGVPVVASDLGCMRELVEHERTGLLFAPGDPAGLAAAARRLLDDDDLAARLGAAGRSVYEERFTPERNHELLCAIYAGVVAGVAPPP